MPSSYRCVGTPARGIETGGGVGDEPGDELTAAPGAGAAIGAGAGVGSSQSNKPSCAEPGKAARPEDSARGMRVGLRIETAHFGLDPSFDLGHHFGGLAAFGRNGFADGHLHHAGGFDEGLARPAARRSHGDGHHPGAGGDGQPRAACFIDALLAARSARAFGKHDDPVALLENPAALFFHPAERFGTLAAVDVHHVQPPQRPAEKRHIEQLAFEHIGQRTRHDQRKGQRFPG